MCAKSQHPKRANLPEHDRHEKQETFAAVPFSDMRGILPGPLNVLAIVLTMDRKEAQRD